MNGQSENLLISRLLAQPPLRRSLYKRQTNAIFHSFFHDFFGIFGIPREAALAADLITAGLWRLPTAHLFRIFIKGQFGMELAFLDLGFLEAALAADLITA